MFATARQGTDSVNVPSSIESNQSNQLGFMEGEGRVPDDFNTMGSKEIEMEASDLDRSDWEATINDGLDVDEFER